jgi:hypothetical protein
MSLNSSKKDESLKETVIATVSLPVRDAVCMLPQPRFRQLARTTSDAVRIQQLWYDQNARVGEWRDIPVVLDNCVPNPAPFTGF